jgi:hypothetical protein
VCGNAQRREVPTNDSALLASSVLLSRASYCLPQARHGAPTGGATEKDKKDENTWLRGGGQLIGGCVGIKPHILIQKKKTGGGGCRAVSGSGGEARRGCGSSFTVSSVPPYRPEALTRWRFKENQCVVCPTGKFDVCWGACGSGDFMMLAPRGMDPASHHHHHHHMHLEGDHYHTPPISRTVQYKKVSSPSCSEHGAGFIVSLEEWRLLGCYAVWLL